MNERFKVLCVGVNRVPGLRKLRFAENDAKTLATHFKVLGNRADVCSLTGKNATRENILNWLKQCNKINEKLTILLFFSCHGSALENKESKVLERELWIDANEYPDTGHHQLKTSEILKQLKNPLHKLIFFIDACYNFSNASTLEQQEIFSFFKEAERNTYLNQYAIISSSSISLFALEDPQLGHGVLTYYVLKILTGSYSTFYKKRISFIKLFNILDKKITSHSFLTDTGRKVTPETLKKNEIMVHASNDNIELPILEPYPYSVDLARSPWQNRVCQWIHHLKCTRFRKKIGWSLKYLALIVLFLVLAHVSMVRIDFFYKGPALTKGNINNSNSFFRHTAFKSFLFGPSGLFLDGLDPERLGKEMDFKKTFILFKYNWLPAFLEKLDQKGKIILLANYLGYPLGDIDQKIIFDYILDFNNRKNIFYWHPTDVNKLLKNLAKYYTYFDDVEKKSSLEFLAELGSRGKSLGQQLFDIKKDKDPEKRTIFIKHFITEELFLENLEELTVNECLSFLRTKKMKRETGKAENNRLFQKITKKIPKNDKKPSYLELELMAHMGINEFPILGRKVFANSLDPANFLQVMRACVKTSHRLWMLDRYFKFEKEFHDQKLSWWQFKEDLFKYLEDKEKLKILIYLVDKKSHYLSLDIKSQLFYSLKDAPAGSIKLNQWQQWMKGFNTARYPAFIYALKMKSPKSFDFLTENYKYFQNNFSKFALDLLYEAQAKKTISMAMSIFKHGEYKDKLNCALFLFHHDHPEYLPYIKEFIRKAPQDKTKRTLLKEMKSSFSPQLLKMVRHNQISKEELRFIFNDETLLYIYAELNYHLWPRETENFLLNLEIPQNYIKGLPILRACEKLPHPTRLKMLKKIYKQNIDETFILNTTYSLIKYYPNLAIPLIDRHKTPGFQFKYNILVSAYRELSNEVLKNRLAKSFLYGYYKETYFIVKAFIEKLSREQIEMEFIQDILHKNNSPIERMLLRDLRYGLNRSLFIRGEKLDDR